MPRFDGRGPFWGYGPGTGRGLGPCGYGVGYGPEIGQGWYKRRFISKKEEAEMIKEEIEDLKQELEAAKERLAEIKGQK